MPRPRSSSARVAAITTVGVLAVAMLGGCASSSTASGARASSPDVSSSAATATATTSATPRPSSATPTPTTSATPKPTAGAYIDLAEYQAKKATYDAAGDVVLFFHASWCPTCKRADGNLSESALPAGLTVVKTDFDSNDELKARYEVTVQHTFVQVDPSGEALAKFTGSDTVEEIAGRTV